MSKNTVKIWSFRVESLLPLCIDPLLFCSHELSKLSQEIPWYQSLLYLIQFQLPRLSWLRYVKWKILETNKSQCWITCHSGECGEASCCPSSSQLEHKPSLGPLPYTSHDTCCLGTWWHASHQTVALSERVHSVTLLPLSSGPWTKTEVLLIQTCQTGWQVLPLSARGKDSC